NNRDEDEDSINGILNSDVEYRIPFFRKDDGGIRSADGKQTYVLGIIDFLTGYGTRKFLERCGKTMCCINRKGMSVMPPQEYAARFMDYMTRHVVTCVPNEF